MPNTQISDAPTDQFPAIGTARLVMQPALREAALVLDALASLAKNDQDTANRIRRIVTELEAGERIDRPCCNNPWRAAIDTALAKPGQA